MASYIPSSGDELRRELDFLGISCADELFSDIPEEVKLQRPLALPDGCSELETRRRFEKLAGENRVFPVILRGAGAYDHFIPSVVKSVSTKEEFVTAYTPYQAEMSQGVLQSIFEYQTDICLLTGMDASNASVYDGAAAAAESIAMCVERNRTTALVSAAANPDWIATMRTYCFGAGRELKLIPTKDGVTDLDALRDMLTPDVCCVFVQNPNFYGQTENVTAAAELAHGAKAKLVAGVGACSLGILKTPAECGADVAVGEGQELGLPLAFGGPYLGFMAATKALTRRLPGRIVGETVDADGNRAYVLTLQAREQHIRREKASSNICSNEALCALTAAAYMNTLGPRGMREVAIQCASKAHYLAAKLCEIDGVKLAFGGEFFDEFVTEMPHPRDAALKALEDAGILGGLPVDAAENGILWCATEKASRDDLDRAAEIFAKAVAK